MTIMFIFLIIGAIIVNGATDAPNAIAACVSSRVLSFKKAVILATIFNFFGVLIMTFFNSKVAVTITKMVNLGTDSQMATKALVAALLSIIIWAVTTWIFGIPTSESHALIAGLTGAAIALNRGFGGINSREWMKVIYGLVLSVTLGFVLSLLITKLIRMISVNIRRDSRFFVNGQIIGAAAMSFMHGAQDGQKFIGVYLTGYYLIRGFVLPETLEIPFWMMLVCSLLMALGTSIGGSRIIDNIGVNMVQLEPYQGFAADITAAVCLLISTVYGLPVSTTHTKTTAMIGAGMAKNPRDVDLKITRDMVLAWVFTFPGCGLLGFIVLNFLQNV